MALAIVNCHEYTIILQRSLIFVQQVGTTTTRASFRDGEALVGLKLFYL